MTEISNATCSLIFAILMFAGVLVAILVELLLDIKHDSDREAKRK